MSARADLFHRLVVDAGLSPHWADRQIDAYAHELAERQRAYANAVTGEPGCWHDGAATVADLIDPEKSAGSVRPDEEPS